jgi:CDP-glucose 4,6-dehydratase
MFEGIYQQKKVLVTGHTGFKGSWLSLWLLKLGAEVAGYALEPPTQPSHFEISRLDMKSVIGDIRDKTKLSEAIRSWKPDIVFHLAAQSLVLRSYRDPVETFETNVVGTVNVFEACRQCESVRAVVNITSDKCYENDERDWGYKEDDPMGGHDPYSASKGCAELATESYRRSFFPPEQYGRSHQTLIASVRAGNVVGGGDWGENRLVPDLVRAAVRNDRAIIRNPKSVRPWQHVLEPLSGYLVLGQFLTQGKREFSGSWNFGSDEEDHLTVLEVVNQLRKSWPNIDFELRPKTQGPHEATFLKLDCSKARAELAWRILWKGTRMFQKTAEWYKAFYDGGRVLSMDQLQEYAEDAKREGLRWALK